MTLPGGIRVGILGAAFLCCFLAPALSARPADAGAANRLSICATSPVVEWAEPDYLAMPASLPAPDDPAYQELIGGLWTQWPVYRMNALAAWDLYPGRFFDAATRPQDTPIVAVIDTGVDDTHPDFMNPGATGTDVAQGGQLMLSAARTFLSEQSAFPQPGARDDDGRGTHLAALIAAAANNGVTAGSGIAGIAYPARLLPLKITSADGVSTHADISQAIIYAADQGAAVILLGKTSLRWSKTLQAAVDYAWDRGCLLVAPVGDDASTFYPAACPHVLGVTASTAAGARADYPSREWVGIAAPGGDAATRIFSALPTYACNKRSDLTGPAYGWLFGTSQAAAHAAGAAALYAGANGLHPATGDEGRLIWQALQRSATAMDIAAGGGWDPRVGYGEVALLPLLLGETTRSSAPGGLVGRVIADGVPAAGAVVSAQPETLGSGFTTTSLSPTGSYRIANIPPGAYQVTATFGGSTGVWERVHVLPGCDVPAVDFALASPTPNAEALTGGIAAAGVRGKPLSFSVTLRNTGAGTWTRGAGYMLVSAPSYKQISGAPDHVALPTAEALQPGQTVTFSVGFSAPAEWGAYDTAWQMSQQGGVGRFGPVVSGTIGVTSFRDVPVQHWAVAYVEAARAAGVVAGYGDDLYQPDLAVTRDQLAAYIARAFAGGDVNVPTGATTPLFSDVGEDHWAFRYVQFARQQQIVNGYPDGTYRPSVVVDRGQLAVIVARAIAAPSGAADLARYAPPATPSFRDVPADFWAYTYVEYLRSRGVVAGYPDTLYHPEYVCTRDQMAVFVARAFGLVDPDAMTPTQGPGEG